MRIRHIAVSLLTLFVLAALAPAPAHAQIWKKVKERAKEAAEDAVGDEVEERTRRGVEGAFDVAEDAVRCVVTDEVCIESASEEGKDVVVVDDEGEVVRTVKNSPDERAAAEEIEAALMAPGEGVWANYDFVPGERVLFTEDYSGDRVGDFPQRFEFVEGNWEVVEWQGRRLFRNMGPRGSAFKVTLPEQLPEQFTIETEVYFPHGNQRLVLMTQVPEGTWGNADYNFFQIAGNHGTGVVSNGREGVESKNKDERVHDGLVPIRIAVDDTYAKVYVGEQRVANVPNASLPRTNTLYVENVYFADQENPMYLGPIRVAAGGRQMMYEQLQAGGEVTTHGILFDTGSSAIRPESTPTLQDMATMLQQHTDLRLRIEGHTDDTGSAETNKQLSQKRAEAVKQYLVDEAGIDGARLEAVGKGPAEPIADNSTPEGRQTNRRVELVKL